MAILKALTRTQRHMIEAAQQARKPVAPKPLFAYDAHVQAYRDHLIANFNSKVKVCKAGKPIKARWPGDADYRSFAPKGVTLLNDKLRGVHARFAVN